MKPHLLLLVLFSALVVACEKEGAAPGDTANDDSTNRGRLQVEITDAPIDDEVVDAVHVTIGRLLVEGEQMPLLSGRKTIELSSLTEGRTARIGFEEVLPVGSYESFEVELLFDEDTSGNGPGCYVKLSDGTKQSLQLPGKRNLVLVLTSGFEIENGQETRLVLDIDLRKALHRAGPGAYTFRDSVSFQRALRLTTRSTSGSVSGTAHPVDVNLQFDKLVVFAYPQGAYRAAQEEEALFANAISSTRINADGSFTLAFLPTGKYELVVADYADLDDDGSVEFVRVLAADANLGLLTRQATVSAGAEAIIDLSLGTVSP